MANIASQMKRNRQTIVRQARNKATRSTLRTYLKKFTSAAEGGDHAAAADAYRSAARRLDTAAQAGVVHRNYAANKKAKMAKRLSSL